MDYLKEYKSFINSHYVSDGVRITAGIVLPALLLNYFDLLATGLVVSLGAMSVSITDTPGPIHHRRNGMLACIIINTLLTAITGFAAQNVWLLGALIAVACFVFSMLTVFGARATSIGVSALLIMVLNIDRQQQGWYILLNAAFIAAGGLWYMLLSLVLYGIRPYKLAQQALGDYIMATSGYLRARAWFYNREVDYPRTYGNMVEEQITVLERQTLARELLFKSRNIVRETTHMGRVLVMIFTDVADLFERSMASYQDYKAMHAYFKDADILEHFRLLILKLSEELDTTGIAVKSGRPSEETGTLAVEVEKTKAYFNAFRDENRTAENLDGFISLRHILDSIEDIATRIHSLHLYTKYDDKAPKPVRPVVEYDKFITHQPVDMKLVRDNFTMRSNIFRHAIRTSAATLTGYISSLFFPVGHSYWILLTIIVILKPAYSLTKKRNLERLTGTVCGALVGLGVLYYVHDNTVLFFIMLALMLGTYTFLRTQYLLGVLFMTPYILLLFHLLNRGSFETIIYDRVIDTLIGSAIAFTANILLLPAWEHAHIKDYMLQVVKDNKAYFTTIAQSFTGKPAGNTEYKLSRKNAFVALANLSDAFTRMLSEPKSRQKNIQHLHQFVVLNHTFTSHIATLSYYAKTIAAKYASPQLEPVINYIQCKLEEAESLMENNSAVLPATDRPPVNVLDKQVQSLAAIRRSELLNGITDSETRKKLSEIKPAADQFNFIINISADIRKMSMEFKE